MSIQKKVDQRLERELNALKSTLAELPKEYSEDSARSFILAACDHCGFSIDDLSDDLAFHCVAQYGCYLADIIDTMETAIVNAAMDVNSHVTYCKECVYFNGRKKTADDHGRRNNGSYYKSCDYYGKGQHARQNPAGSTIVCKDFVRKEDD